MARERSRCYRQSKRRAAMHQINMLTALRIPNADMVCEGYVSREVGHQSMDYRTARASEFRTWKWDPRPRLRLQNLNLIHNSWTRREEVLLTFYLVEHLLRLPLRLHSRSVTHRSSWNWQWYLYRLQSNNGYYERRHRYVSHCNFRV